MALIVEVQYNPYIPQMRILLDGNQPPEYSRLIQFSDEDIWEWYNEILEILYQEIRESFYVIFTGTQLDAHIMQYQCERYEYCAGFKAKPFIVSDSLQKRLGRLNQIVKENKKVPCKRTMIHAFFDIAPSLTGWSSELLELNIENLFCCVKMELVNNDVLKYGDNRNSFLFIVSESVEEGIKRLKNYYSRKWIYVLCCGEKTAFHSVNENGLIYEILETDLFKIIFEFLLHRPLLETFRSCIGSFSDEIYCQDAIHKICMVEPMIKVDVKSEIEVGRSAPIHTKLEPPIGQVPKLQFRIADSQMGMCDGVNVFGKKEGQTNLEVYQYGEKLPFYVQKIKFVRRNRITKLLLSEDELILGIGDTKALKCDVFPENADNKSMITWKSSDRTIVSVDSRGHIKALKRGVCKVICTAENVSSSCICRVKPYLEEIILDIPLDEKGNVQMEAGQEITMGIKLVPEDCIDNSIQFESSDYDVVNVVSGKLMAKNAGKATICVMNKTKSKMVDVFVLKKKESFFGHIFRKR